MLGRPTASQLDSFLLLYPTAQRPLIPSVLYCLLHHAHLCFQATLDSFEGIRDQFVVRPRIVFVCLLAPYERLFTVDVFASRVKSCYLQGSPAAALQSHMTSDAPPSTCPLLRVAGRCLTFPSPIDL